MNSSTRLYERLGQIPQDPEDPESLEDLVVCAFGAFERYYVCWKTRGGNYRQDGFDLPPPLKDWLFPTDGSTRDFPTLQVVFGRGDEYFASDKDGKLENKEPEKPPPAALEDDRSVLRRSRTMSLWRPLSDPNAKSITPPMEASVTGRRSSSLSSSQPPSMPFGRPIVDSGSTSQTSSRPSSTALSRPSSEITLSSLPSSRPSSTTSSVMYRHESDLDSKSADSVVEMLGREPSSASSLPTTRLTRRSRPLSMTFSSISFPKILEGRQMASGSSSPSRLIDPAYCTCGCHSTPLPPRKPNYADAAIQTDPPASPPPTSLRINTDTQSFPPYSNGSSALEIQTPLTEDLTAPHANPFFMGTMMDYFSKPGYQLGDSLMSSYHYDSHQMPIYEYQDTMVDEQWDARARGQTV